MLFVLSLLPLFASTAAIAGDDAFGEALFFGRNYDHMRVMGPEGNVVQDKYGDVKVVLCAPGKWMISVDPNRCQRSLAHGQPCNEIAMPPPSGPWSAVFARGNFYLTNSWSGDRQEIDSIGLGKYAINVGGNIGRIEIWQAEKPLTQSQLAEFCAR